MLAQARAKGGCRDRIEADLTGLLDIPDGVYGGVVSAGAFTHGHLGPEALDELIRIARPGAPFRLAVNAAHYTERGFDAALAAQVRIGAITEPELTQIPIYASAAPDDSHAHDEAIIVGFARGQ